MIKDYHKTAIITADHEVSYTELLQRVSLFATLTPKKAKAKTLIFSENREGWIYALFSIWHNQGIIVPVDASSTVEDVAYIIKDCRPEAVWTSKALAGTVKEAMLTANHDMSIMLIDDYERTELPAISSMSEEYDMDATAIIVYTSGTTGSPKGVMLSFANLFANMRGVADEVKIFNENRRTMILLPLHHILPLMGTAIIPILRGGGVAICPSMSGPDIMDTLCRGKISIFVGVPRLWQTLYTGIKKKIDANPVTRALFTMCEKANNPKLSRIVFSSIRKKMGGHLDYCVSGGAALDKEIGRGLRTIGLDVLEGYGMTETAPIITFTRPGDIIPGCVGLPLPSVQCKLFNASPSEDLGGKMVGELIAKGPNVMQGYYNRPEETAAIIDKEGFIHTGDLAYIDSKGRVTITGRSKEIIVLSNGKNVQPNEIEFKLEKFEDKVKEAAITEKDDMLLAIIVPQEQWSRSLNDDDAAIEQVLKKEVIEPYNLTVENYKKVMKIFVYHGELPRTKLDKLQRFKLKAIISQPDTNAAASAPVQEQLQEGNVLEEFKIVADYIAGEKKLQVRPTDHIETDLAFDSLDKVSLQGFIEQTFGVTINADAMTQFDSIMTMAQYIADYKTRIEKEDVDWKRLLTESRTTLQLPDHAFTHPIYAKMFKAYFRVYNRLSIKGVENIPAKGPYILAANHQSYLDAPIMVAGLSASQLNDCYFYATEEHVGNAALKYMARHHNIILMERRNLKNSILKLAEVIKMGKNIAIFPEGTRTHTGKMNSFKKMFAIIAKELNVPIIPVCIDGAYDMLPRGSRFIQPCKVRIKYLPPVIPEADMSYDDLSEKVKAAIQQASEVR